MDMSTFSTLEGLSDVKFIEKLLIEIHDHFNEPHLIDVTFKLSNPTALVTAHRLILSAASPYFEEFLKSDAGICPIVEITDIDSDTFERLIIFCYTGETLATEDNLDRMLKAAWKYQLDDAVRYCADFIIECMPDYTLKRLYALESETQSAILIEKILKYEVENFMSVSQSAEFLNIDFNKLHKILLECDELNVPTEKDVVEAIKRWYEHDASARKQQLPGLIACLRLTKFDTNFLLLNILPLPGCHDLAVEALTWIGYPVDGSTQSIKYTNPGAGPNLTSETSLFALNIDGGESRTIYQYNKTEEMWQKWFDIKKDANWFEVILMDDSLVFIGGHRKFESTTEVHSWNIRTKTFQQLPSMNSPRRAHGLVMLDDKIYAIGGEGLDDVPSQLVEMYSVSNGSWKSIKSMIKPRCHLSAVSLNGRIYAIGGRDNIFMDYFKSVECYDPTTDCWTLCADMLEKRTDAGAAVHNGHIFVVGGSYDQNMLQTVERYDPQINAWTKVVLCIVTSDEERRMQICSLNVALKVTSCISIDNQLWVIGGCNEGYNYESQALVYDEPNDKWIAKEPIPMDGRYYSFTAPKALFQTE